MLPASEDLMGNMKTGFLHGLFSRHGTGQRLLEEGIVLVTALAGVAKEPSFLRGRRHHVCLYCRPSYSAASKVGSKASIHHGNLKI